MKKIKHIIALIPMIFSWQLNAQVVDTIRVGDHFKNIDQLEMGTTKDIIFTEMAGVVRSVSLKTKSTEKVNINGIDYLAFRHSWTTGSPETSGDFYYLCEPETLKPVQHIRNTKQNGKEAFSFQEMKIVGLDSATDNKQKDFNLELTEPTYNWEIDLETYSLLPMKMGYEAVMNFYHPGGSAPSFYHLKIIGSEKLILPDGLEMDCWVLFTDYGGTQPTKFWYTKTNQNFIKMEGKYKQLTIRKERIF
ncbi:hypothetical protein [uncultured Roseivirga sp.]|uniref:DUF3108 domain-containing protein n=1 Tax=uncultured Roseivirga sp. TaxID=543088 RepID=UPI0030DC9E38|tara:strand:+ start:81 stop:824 length:744 start_codon:yes stop_codon:yes gene_type:complete